MRDLYLTERNIGSEYIMMSGNQGTSLKLHFVVQTENAVCFRQVAKDKTKKLPADYYLLFR